MPKRITPSQIYPVLVFAVIIAGLYATSLYSYLLFHSLVEIFAIIISLGIFVITWNARRFIKNNYLVIIGISFLFTGFIDVIHTLAYKGMGVFPQFGSNLPTQLWIAARYMQAFSFLAAPLFLGRNLKPGLVFTGYFAVTALVMVSIFAGVFPVCYVDGVGLTPFKIISEYVISAFFVFGMWLLYRKRREFDRGILNLLYASIVLTVAAELCFTSYVGVYDLMNLAGHLFNILAFYLIYKAFLETGISQPYALLLRDLKQNEIKLNEHASKLDNANKQLEAVNRELEAFNYSVSHDLRAPLRTIDGFSNMLKEDYAGSLDERGRGYIATVGVSVSKMSNLIEDLLGLSRLSRLPMKVEKTDLSAIAGSVVAGLRQAEPERQVELIVHPGLTANADPGLARIALENLLRNAWKYTGKNDNAKIEVGAEMRDGKPVFYVRDNGVGFDMAHAQKLFQPFQRLHSEKDFPGSGIGLATVRRILHRHGGEIWAESEVGNGTTFYFTLE